MAVHSYEDLKGHVGHDIVCVAYGDYSTKEGEGPANIAIECETCNTVLFDYNNGEED